MEKLLSWRKGLSLDLLNRNLKELKNLKDYGEKYYNFLHSLFI